MWRVIAALAVALAPVPAAAQADIAKIAQVAPGIDRIFADYHLDSHAPGLTYGIVADGRLVHVRSFGVQELKAKRPVTPDTLFRIASMSKAFTALAILKLRDEGKLSLDAPAETYVPELRAWRYPTADSRKIRVRDLLNHTAGLVTDDPWGDRQQVLSDAEFTALLRQSPPFSRAPGTAFEYSNYGFAILGRIVANVSGEPFDDYIVRNIMRPLGMNSTGYDVFASPLERRAIGYRWENNRWSEEPTMRRGAFGAMGGVQTSGNDYAKWIAFLLSGWPARDQPETGPVKRPTIREMAEGSNYVSLRQRFGKSPETQAAAYAMGLFQSDDPELGNTLSHGGGYPGYGSHMMLMPEHGVGIFVFTNRTYNGGSGAAWDAAVAFHSAGALLERELAVSAHLAAAYRAAGEIYRAGDVSAAANLLAMNFLMDRSRENWRRELAKLRDAVGQCDTASPIAPGGALSGSFTWRCARGRIRGDLLLAPTTPAGIQALRLRATP
jgi:serine-type D-Ala-D-Ala carboxypeptidase/endopeptidase